MTNEIKMNQVWPQLNFLPVADTQNLCYKVQAEGRPVSMVFGDVVDQKVISQLAEAQSTGTYFILHGNEGYVGESKTAVHRMLQSIEERGMNGKVVCITHAEGKFYKPHAQRLEALLIQDIELAGKVKLLNRQRPKPESIPLTERDLHMIYDFYSIVKIMLDILLAGILTPERGTTPMPQPEPTTMVTLDGEEMLLVCKTKCGARSVGTFDPKTNGITIQEGSTVRWNSGCDSAPIAEKQELIEANILQEVPDDQNKLQFAQPFTFLPKRDGFTGLSAAAKIIRDRSSNGWTDWRDLSTGNKATEVCR